MTWRDVRLIMPTLVILLFTLLIILTVIPYAFSSVIKQLRMVQAMEEAGEYHTSDKSTQYSVKWFSSFLEAAKTNATI